MPWSSGYVSSTVAWLLDIFICQVKLLPIDQSKCKQAMMLPPPGLLDCSKERHALYDISKTEILCTALDLQKKSQKKQNKAKYGSNIVLIIKVGIHKSLNWCRKSNMTGACSTWKQCACGQTMTSHNLRIALFGRYYTTKRIRAFLNNKCSQLPP